MIILNKAYLKPVVDGLDHDLLGSVLGDIELQLKNFAIFGVLN